MNIIKITNKQQVPQPALTYVAETSPLNAAEQHRQAYGELPHVVYHLVRDNGRSTVYIPLPSTTKET